MPKQRFVVHLVNGKHQTSAWGDDPEGVAEVAEFLSVHGLNKFDRLSLELESGSVMHFNTDHVVAVEIQTASD